jgi:uncharacterized protein YbbC (DUF1343 family)
MKFSFQNCAKNVFLFLLILSFTQTSFAIPQPAAYNLNDYLPMLKGKTVAVVVNQTSTIGKTHLVDTLLKRGVKIAFIFAPEHGFRGDHSDGAVVSNAKDVKTGLSIISLYGNNKKPSTEQMKGLDFVIFDIQDVGVRFYTYISTMHYVMEACAENQVSFMVLDRPNPNGHYVDGPVLEDKFKSFVGMHPIPVVHGLTVGELAQMINGEKWLKGGITCNLTVIKATDYYHSDFYHLPIAPSPNLPNQLSVLYYPSLCFFEGTQVSLGRGTAKPFQVFGFPGWNTRTFSFTPRTIPGVSDNPPLKNKECFGFDLSNLDPEDVFERKRINLDWLITAYDAYPDKSNFFIPFFEKLAGNDKLRKQIEKGQTESEIRASWQSDLAKYQKLRMKYLLYPLWR